MTKAARNPTDRARDMPHPDKISATRPHDAFCPEDKGAIGNGNVKTLDLVVTAHPAKTCAFLANINCPHFGRIA